jgi:hypothetical protein
MTTDKIRQKMYSAVCEYATKFGHDDEDSNGNYSFDLATSEQVYQSDHMQEDGLELICKLLDILNGESLL